MYSTIFPFLQYISFKHALQRRAEDFSLPWALTFSACEKRENFLSAPHIFSLMLGRIGNNLGRQDNKG